MKRELEGERARFVTERGELIREKDQKIALVMKENNYYQEMIR